MYVCNRIILKTGSIFLLVGLMLAPMSAVAVPGAVHDVHRLPGNDEFQRTIEARCTICHTRERVDAAFGQQADLDALDYVIGQPARYGADDDKNGEAVEVQGHWRLRLRCWKDFTK